MIKPLRTYHVLVWRILAVALPPLLTLAILKRPEGVIPVHDKEDFSFSASRKNDSTSRIEIEVITPLKVSSCAVYAVYGDKKILLGLLTRRGKYTYDAPSSAQDVLLYDKLHDGVILKKKIPLNDN